jgi:hypothetical protein
MPTYDAFISYGHAKDKPIATGGNADIAAARALRPGIAEDLAKFGVP